MKRTVPCAAFLALVAGMAMGIGGIQLAGENAMRTFGGPLDDRGSSLRLLDDGGYIVAGETDSSGAGGTDLYLLRTDASLNVLWERTFGGPGYDIGNEVRICPDGGFVVVGHTSSNGAGKADLWLLKTDAEGRQVWSKTFGTPEDDWGFAVLLTDGGGYIAAGSSGDIAANQDIFVVRTDEAGNEVWTRTYGGDKDENGDGLAAVEGGYVVSGTTESFGALEADAFLMAIDSNGEMSWIQTYGGQGVQFGHKLAVSADGGLVLAGASISPATGEWNALAVRTDDRGKLLRLTTFGLPGAGEEYATTVLPADDGGFYFCGTSPAQNGGGPDFLAAKLNSRLKLEWQRTYGGSGRDVGLSAARSGTGLTLVGFSDSFSAGSKDVCLIPLGRSGFPRIADGRRFSVAGGCE